MIPFCKLIISHRILITGASGYLGGDLLAQLPTANLPSYEKLYALVRTDEQAEAVKKHGAEPIRINVQDSADVRNAVVGNKITVVYYLIDPVKSEAQVHFINALSEVKKQTGSEVHFLHTTGAKIFSESFAGSPTNEQDPLLDTRKDLYEIQKNSKPPVAIFKTAVATNNTVIEQAELKDVRAYIFAPCIVYGKSQSFGNPISIQTVAVVKAAKAAGAVYNPNSGRFTWPVCHVSDNTGLYIAILRGILEGQDIGHGKKGYFLASPGSVAWDDIYATMAKALAKRKVIGSPNVLKATDADLERMAKGLGRDKEFVIVDLGGLCTMTAIHGGQIGWKAKYAPEHILDHADQEAETILTKI